MDLHTGKPFWVSQPTAPLRRRRLRCDLDCDVAIVGAGITGALVARQLLEAGLRVVVLDKRPPGFGSTAASTGLLLYQPDTSIADLTRLHGRRIAQRVYELGRKAIRDLGALIRELEIDCGWDPRRTLYVASSRRDAADLRREAKRTRKFGFPAEALSAASLRDRYELDAPGALLAPGSAQVNALALTRGVLARCQRERRRFRLFQPVRVRSLRETADGVTLTTTDGPRVRARHVVVAAGYESRQFVTSKLIKLHSTYVIASRPFPPADLEPVRCLMWETARPYFYLRTTADHRIVFGGEDEPFSNPSRRDRKLRAKTRGLEARFAELFPRLAFRADYTWTGTFAETLDGLPCIGPATPGSRILHALGYGGNGITFSQIAARLLRDNCLEKPHPDAALFAFDRLEKPPRRPR